MKSIIIYFSRADENYGVGYVDKGNTEVLAEYIKELTGSDIFKVERVKPYPKDYATCIKEAKEELINNERPEIVNTLPSINQYDLIYLGSPVYWDYMPQPMLTQLEKLNWNGKIIKPFITHEGSGAASIPEQIKKVCVGANVTDALVIKGSKVRESKELVEEWCRK